MVTTEQLKRIVPFGQRRVPVFLEFLNAAMDEFEINTAQRQAMFLAQVAHESGSFVYTCEIASGRAYEGRVDLGNTEVGDGVKYKGRGLIQITGRANYEECGKVLGVDLLTYPDLLMGPELAARSAAWFWKRHGLNELADAGDFERITKRINGGLNGELDRIAFYNRAKEVLA